MSHFYVGQRLRIKWSRNWPDLAGKEGAIVEASEDGGLNGTSEWIVAPDCWGVAIAPHPGLNGAARFGPSSSQLEPITDSYDKVEWSACLWAPEHLRDRTT